MIDKGSILIVDDDTALRYTLLVIFQKAGYSVSTAMGGLDALNQFSNAKYDLVILDISMPDLDGLSVLSEMKGISPKTPVMLLTAYPSSETMEVARVKGACQYLIKPVDPQYVLEVVKNILN